MSFKFVKYADNKNNGYSTMTGIMGMKAAHGAPFLVHAFAQTQ